MSEFRIESWIMPAANLGPEDPLPQIEEARDLHAVAELPGIPDEMRSNIAYGHLPGVLPYTIQNGYERDRQQRAFRAVVLENEILRATFLPEIGGRLWSLFHKPSGSELLTVNPVFQPANLALRNAWFSGGVEWNIGTIGHTPTTCSPLFAARAALPDGTPVLRMWEFERMRRVWFQIDAYLPDGAEMLRVHVRIVNPHKHDTPMYWWSNIAVPEEEGKRVLVPAESAYRFGYTGRLDVVPVPAFDGVDRTYSTVSKRAIDYFFHVDVDGGRRPWITALDRHGAGLVQTSTQRLKGRKLFLWGTGSGGARWQEFLAPGGKPYLEIQSGLARTQLEHVRMPAQTTWSWLEGYGLMEADPATVHGADWAAAQTAIEDNLQRRAPRSSWEAEHTNASKWMDTPPIEMIQLGSGWGALENIRRAAAGEEILGTDGAPFDSAALGEQQQPWLQLLQTGHFPQPDVDAPPLGFQVQPEWRVMLEQAAAGPEKDNWFTWLHLGVMHAYAGAAAAASAAWHRSNELLHNAWALRNLAATTGNASLYVEAHALLPHLRTLTIEACRTLWKADRPQECLALINTLPTPERENGRIRLYEGMAALAAGDLDRVRTVLDANFIVDDLREGDTPFSDLWFGYHEQRLKRETGAAIDDALRERVRREYPLPRHYDFRMTDT
ncbi:MAG: DUF5107 domain-containing protein [Chloroflexi bacterium]|nr:DUF5107 domain-containing protein [Chloroflexota bacterium]